MKQAEIGLSKLEESFSCLESFQICHEFCPVFSHKWVENVIKKMKIATIFSASTEKTSFKLGFIADAF